MTDSNRPLKLTLNGKAVSFEHIPDDLLMIDFLHEYLNLTGTRRTCGQGVCHACVVIIDHDDGSSETMRSCITGTHFFNGKQVRTIEGHHQGIVPTFNELTAIQQAFLTHYSFQCSYCTPGFVNEATVLIERLKRHPVRKDQVEETITAALNSHLCRCTGYVRYYQAVKEVILATPGLTKGS